LLTRWPESCLKDLNKRRLNNKDEDFKASVVIASFVLDQNLLSPTSLQVPEPFAPEKLELKGLTHRCQE